ncbi:hypothetical protein Tco_1323196 [Tanacetum coccineum]
MLIPWTSVRGSKTTSQGFLKTSSNWLERLPVGSNSTWEDLTTRFLAQFFPPGRTLRDENVKESWALLEDLVLYDNESWNDTRNFVKPVKAISLTQDIPSTSDRRLIELENQVQRLMEAHLAPKKHVQVNKISSLCEIYSGPHDTQYCMENPEQAFVKYASSRTDEAGGLVSNIMASQDARLSKFEADFKQQHGEMTKKIDTVLKAIIDRITGALPSDTLGDSKPFDALVDLGPCVNIIPLYLFKKLKIGLLEETDHVFGLADGTKSYPVEIMLERNSWTVIYLTNGK